MTSSGAVQASESSSLFPFEVCNLLLGKGGSGQVFLGRDGGSSKYVAIKKRYGRHGGSEAFLNRQRVRSCDALIALEGIGSQASKHSFVPSLGARFFSGCDGGAPLTELSEYIPPSHQRELDVGEESVSQTAALSQQQGVCHTDDAVDGATKPPLAPPLTDEVSVLSYLGPHPQIVAFLGSYTTSRNASFFTMELMDSDVGRELKEGNTTLHEESVCVAIAYSVLLALDEMHSRAVAHRDVKPGNILLKRLAGPEDWACTFLSCTGGAVIPRGAVGTTTTPHGTVTVGPTLAAHGANEEVSYVKAALGDFSAAHSVRCADEIAFSDTRGTLHYKCPEQLMGKRSTVAETVAAVDLWGLGCTLYEMITGTRPFPGSSELQVLMNILDSLGSDIQSFPAANRHAALYEKLPGSPAFVDLLRRLLCLDPVQRCTAKEALRHPLFAAFRRSDLARCTDEERSATAGNERRLIGIPLVLRYASVTALPDLRFNRISRTPRKAAGLMRADVSSAAQPLVSDCCGAQAAAVAAAPDHLASANHGEGGCSDAAAASSMWEPGTQCEDHGENETPAKGLPLPPHYTDTTATTSLLSESSYLHWSEIRPVARPSGAPMPTQPPPPGECRVRSCSSNSSRAVTFSTSVTAGGTPSLCMGGTGTLQHHPRCQRLSGSLQRHSECVGRSTVARALNISCSSVKGGRAERSESHVDFDLSPAPATPISGTDADSSSCMVPHPAVALLQRRTHPVLHLTSGSTFTASNLRANAYFERDNLAACYGAPASAPPGGVAPAGATLAGHCSTPRQHPERRLSAIAGRALCFSEETDRFARRSWGSSASQQSCLNSLLASPAPVQQVAAEACSPQPSPIRHVAPATRSSSALPTVANGLMMSSDDSGVGLEWVGVPPSMATAPSCGEDSGVAHRAAPTVATCAAGAPDEEYGGGHRSLAESPSCPSVRRVSGGLSRALPLPIPLSVATVCLPAAQPHGVAAAPQPCTPVVTALHETPRTQRFACATAALRKVPSAPHDNSHVRHVRHVQSAQGPVAACQPDGCGTGSAATLFLRDRDVNASPPEPVCQRGGATSASQRHCTPTISEPSTDTVGPASGGGPQPHHIATAAASCAKTGATRCHPAAATTAADGPHTPLRVHGPCSPSMQRRGSPLPQLAADNGDSNGRPVRRNEGDRIATPCSAQRGSLKRAREEDALGVAEAATARQSTRVV
ncbi:protein kinase [Novymonas esmeraldas]|uniref:Protein kinase n=1 Tax=Novymonas esmeraldas TaxID=1808958 RepID=A0AAW0EKQ2_9TRYP